MPTPDLNQLAQTLLSNSTLTNQSPLHGGISAQMTKFTLTSPTKTQSYVLRIPNPAWDTGPKRQATKEFTLLKLLQPTQIPTPAPIFLDPDQSFYIMEHLNGTVNLNPKNLHNHVKVFAQSLAQIHQTPLTSKLQKLVPQYKINLPSTPTCQDTAHIQAHNALKNLPIPNHDPTHLLHGDLWPGNTLWNNEKLIGIVDWEEPLIGPPIYDLAITRLDLTWIFGPQACQTFTHEYQSLTNINLTHLPYFDLLSSLRIQGEFQSWSSAFPKLNRPDITAQTMQQTHYQFVQNAITNLKS